MDSTNPSATHLHPGIIIPGVSAKATLAEWAGVTVHWMNIQGNTKIAKNIATKKITTTIRTAKVLGEIGSRREEGRFDIDKHTPLQIGWTTTIIAGGRGIQKGV